MVSVEISLVFCFLVFHFQNVYSHEIDEDYFFGPKFLRTVIETQECYDKATEYRCHLKCGRHYVCEKDVCNCLVSADDQALMKNIKNINHDDDYKFSLRPTLRHHIAHFCPNLEIARQCIRKCMALGKPAFCGKDHVCYCGHKTKNPMYGAKIDEMQKEFRDMYAKYFDSKRESTDSINLHGSSSESTEHTAGG